MIKEFEVNQSNNNCNKHLICPDCIDHLQENRKNYLDCKNLATENGQIVGQCYCCSAEHGERK